MPDPYLILGLPEEADDEAIQRAYLEGVRRCPADRDPERFQAIRAAYEQIRDARARAAWLLFSTDVPTPAELLERLGRSATPSRPSLELMQRLLRGGANG